MGEVDLAFIQEPEHKPRISYIKGEGIPVIDLSPLHSSNKVSAFEGPVKEISNACKDWGFILMINHGVPLEKRQKIEKKSRRFFAQSLEEKRKVKRTKKQVLGYCDSEHTKNVRVLKEVFDFIIEEPTLVPGSHEPTNDKELAGWTNLWPEYPPEFRETCQEYIQEIEKVAFKLMELVALSLSLPADRSHDFFKDQTSFVRLNYYPICLFPHLALGLGQHKDSGALTILGED